VSKGIELRFIFTMERFYLRTDRGITGWEYACTAIYSFLVSLACVRAADLIDYINILFAITAVESPENLVVIYYSVNE